MTKNQNTILGKISISAIGGAILGISTYGIFGGTTSAATGTEMLAGVTTMAIIGALAGIIGYLFHKGYKTINNKKTSDTEAKKHSE